MTFTRPRAARRKIGSNRFSCQVYFTTALTAKVSFIAHTHKSDTFSMEAAALKSNKFGESRLIKAEPRWKRAELLFKLLKNFSRVGFRGGVFLFRVVHLFSRTPQASNHLQAMPRVSLFKVFLLLGIFEEFSRHVLACVCAACKFGYFLRCCQLVSTARRSTENRLQQKFPPEILLMTRH